MTNEIVKDLLISAFEGGSNYWYTIVDHNRKETKAEFTSEVLAYENGRMSIQTDDHEEIWQVNNKDVKGAIALMEQKYPRHYKDAIEENGDAETGDVFLQLVVFGEVIYG